MRYFIFITLILLGNVKAFGQDVITVSGEIVRAQTMVDAINYEIQNSTDPIYQKTNTAKLGNTNSLGKNGKVINLKFNGVDVGNVFVSKSMNTKQNNPKSEIAVSELLNSYCREQKAMITLALNMLSKQQKSTVVLTDCTDKLRAWKYLVSEFKANKISYESLVQEHMKMQNSVCQKYMPIPKEQDVFVSDIVENFEDDVFDKTVIVLSCEDIIAKWDAIQVAYDHDKRIFKRKPEAKTKFKELKSLYPDCLVNKTPVWKNLGVKVAVVAGVVYGSYKLGQANSRQGNDIDGEIEINENDSNEEDGGVFGGNESGDENNGRSGRNGKTFISQITKKTSKKRTGW